MSWRLWLGIGFGLGTDFQVVREGGTAFVRGRIAAAKAAEIRSFVRDELGDVASFAVACTFGPRRSIRFRWAGSLDRWSRQRVRNVLVEVLK